MTTYTRVDLSQYVVVSIWFGCNNRCSICMLGNMKHRLPVIGFDQFRHVLDRIRRDGRFKKLILSGAEVTTFDELDRYVQMAAASGWFETIQIQTNGRRLCDPVYVQHLIDCGVNEFFVSVHGLETVHDAITGVPGAFRQTLAGIRNLNGFDVNTITNTVLTRDSLGDVPALFERLLAERIGEMHLWNYFPMERTDTKGQVVRMQDFIDLLPKVLALGERFSTAVVLKGFPACLDMGEPGFFDGLFPVTVLPDMFWRQFGECGFGTCVYRDRCQAEVCWGLSSAYIERYGDERERLVPIMVRAGAEASFKYA